MLKIRITYNRNNEEELREAIKSLEEQFNILSESKVYEGRGKSVYNNIYLDVENKKQPTFVGYYNTKNGGLL